MTDIQAVAQALDGLRDEVHALVASHGERLTRLETHSEHAAADRAEDRAALAKLRADVDKVLISKAQLVAFLVGAGVVGGAASGLVQALAGVLQ